MPAQGTLNADSLSIARFTVDMLQQTPKVHALTALVNTKTGKTLAWAEGEGGMWSNETMIKLKELLESAEADMAKALCVNTVDTSVSKSMTLDGAGLGEHLGEGGAAEAPSV